MRPLYLILALVVAGGLTLYINSLLSNREVPQVVQQINPIVQPQTQSRVLVAAKNLPTGHILTADDLKFQPWPADAIQEGFIREQDNVNPADLAGSVVRIETVLGEPIQRAKVVAPGERGFLAAVLRPGMKAIAIPVNARTAVANLVMPGDRVDVMLTQTLEKKSGQQDASGEGAAQQDSVTEQVTETIIYNARVLATGQSLSQIQDDKNNQQGNAYDTVTLELTPKLVEVVTLANELGRLSVALNPLAKKDDEVTANAEAQARLEQWPYGIQAVVGAGDTSTYSFTEQGEASPARKKVGSTDGSGISVYRGGKESGVSARSTSDDQDSTQGRK